MIQSLIPYALRASLHRLGWHLIRGKHHLAEVLVALKRRDRYFGLRGDRSIEDGGEAGYPVSPAATRFGDVLKAVFEDHGVAAVVSCRPQRVPGGSRCTWECRGLTRTRESASRHVDAEIWPIWLIF